MKVICIKEFTNDGVPEKDWDKPRPLVGDIDEVISTNNAYGVIYYRLKRFGPILNYISNRFAQLSDLDETELVNETIEECIK